MKRLLLSLLLNRGQSVEEVLDQLLRSRLFKVHPGGATAAGDDPIRVADDEGNGSLPECEGTVQIGGLKDGAHRVDGDQGRQQKLTLPLHRPHLILKATERREKKSVAEALEIQYTNKQTVPYQLQP